MYQLILNEKRSRVRGLPDLPPFPAVGQQILRQVTSEQVDIPRLAKTIERDPAVFGRIIGVANSAYYGCQDTIYTISHAIVRVLGLNVVKSLALGIVLNEPFRHTVCQGFDMKRHWFQSLYTAMLAQMLARHIDTNESDFNDQAYIAGMLNNLGELVLAYLFPSEMSDVMLRIQREPDIDMMSLQADTVGLTSYEAVSILAKKWHLPVSLQTVFKYRDSPEYEGRYSQLVHLTRLSDQLASSTEIDEMSLSAEVSHLADRLGLKNHQMEKLVKKIPAIYQEVSNLATVLSEA